VGSLANESPSPKRARLAEFLGLVSFAFALMLLISLATYAPGDPAPFFRAGAARPAHNFIGPFGAFLAELLIPQLFGLASLLLPLVLATLGWKLFWCKPIDAPYTKAAGLSLMLLSLTALLSLLAGTVTIEGEAVRAGGAVGALLAGLLTASFNRPGAYIVAATSLFVSVILATQFSFAAFLLGGWGRLAARLQALRTAWAHLMEARRKEKLRRDVIKKHAQKEQEATSALLRIRKVAASENASLEDLDFLAPDGEAEQEPAELPFVAGSRAPAAAPAQRSLLPPPAEPEDRDDTPQQPKPRARKRSHGPVPDPKPGQALPPVSILEEPRPTIALDQNGLFEKGRILQAKCGEFGVMGVVKEISPGPVVTTYEFKPDAGVKYSKVVGLADDLALALQAESIRIDRMSGKGTVGIEIPNDARETISLREIIESEAFQRASGRLTMALGKSVGGDPCVTDLATMPHLLIAGATGQGKSVGLNCMIASLLFKATPAEVRLILIDPKRLELGVYEDIPHLLTPVVTDPKIAANVLKWAVSEMERRIRRLASEGVRNIDQFNNIVRAEQKGGDADPELAPLHYIVIIIDELADLMMVSSHEVEESITRLAQMARAVGIHLILATQRPSVDVLTGLIKANFPSRISFKVSARVDSRTILDSIGAEHLLGKGDMLFLPPGSAKLVRIHGAYVDEKEIARLTSYLRKTAQPVYDDSVGRPEKSEKEALAAEDRDDLFDEAVRFVVQSGQASTSMLQRRFRIGFSRAGRLVDIMERDGIVGPADGSKPREILVAKDYYEEVDARLQ
jgi:S-DNA-T family DNA segregation ATPase FtsK/SpoIIIE